MKTFALHTLGCKVNQFEGEEIKAVLLNAGHNIKEFGKSADVYIINTCSVTKVSDAKSRQFIKKAIKLGKKVYVTGCSVENEKSNVAIDGVEIISQKNKSDSFKKIFRLNKKESHQFRSRPLIKIQDGCNEACSYCIVPNLRGISESINPEEILERIKGILSEGYKEVVLTGINIGLYEYKGHRLKDLIKEINSLDSDFRVRISSIEMNSLNEELINELFSRKSKVVNHLHIPIQSGSDSILKMMNRPYNTKQFENKINQIKSINKDVVISTDCIVGFPGETKNDFKDTLKIIKRIGFTKVHVFRYSPRPKTKANMITETVEDVVKKERSHELQIVADDLRFKYSSSQVGKILKVLCERQEDGYIYGQSGNYLRVRFKGSAKLLTDIVTVRIQKATVNLCEGKKV